MPETFNFQVASSAGAGLKDFDELPISGELEVAGTVVRLAVPKVKVLTETHLASSFTDGGATVGTKAFTGSLPAGAVILGTKVLVPAGFAGDTTAALTIGDGSDVDRYNTSTVSIFATAATGVESGVPSGAKLQIAAVAPVLTVTSTADFTSVVSGGGSVTVSIFYIQTV